MLIAGSFTSVNGTPRVRVARLLADGSVDPSFDTSSSGPDSPVNTVALQPDGRVIIGGQFFNVGVVQRRNLARLNSDGSVDTTFSTSANVDSPILSAAVLPDGKVLVGGSFDAVGGVARSKLARLNIDGTLDTSFGNAEYTSGTMYSIVVQPDGKILVAGDFSTIYGTPRKYVARLNADGTVDPDFSADGDGPDTSTRAIALQSDGKLVIAGGFSAVRGVGRPRLARLNADGTLDGTFTVGTGSTMELAALALQGDGKLWVGGGMNAFNGVTRAYLARLSTTDAALESVEASATRNGLRWLRTGPSPALRNVRMAVTTSESTPLPAEWSDTADVTVLSPGGWAWDNLPAALPRNEWLWVHTEGEAISGRYSGSHAVVRSAHRLFIAPLSMAPTVVDSAVSSAPLAVTLPTPGAAVAPVTFAVAGAHTLPAGLALDGATGRMTGTLATPGEYRVTVIATDAAGEMWEIPVALTLAAAPTATTAVPADAPWALVLLSLGVAWLGWRRHTARR